MRLQILTNLSAGTLFSLKNIFLCERKKKDKGMTALL
jgi:hypothetical protein